MKFATFTFLFLNFGLAFVPTTNAFKCYKCGEDPFNDPSDPDYQYDNPCPDGPFDNDPKYIVECPAPKDANEVNSCKWSFEKFSVVNKYITFRDCSATSDYIECSTNDGQDKYCKCFESLCNGVELNEMLDNGKKPFNPFTTTKRTTTPRPPPYYYLDSDYNDQVSEESKAAAFEIPWPFIFISQVIHFCTSSLQDVQTQ